MAILTFTTPPASSNLIKKTNPRVLGAQFGDGYGAGAPDGINTMLMTLEVSWVHLTFTEADTMDAFLRDRKGVESFYWTKPREVSPRKWRCKDWSQADQQTLADFTAKFEEQP